MALHGSANVRVPVLSLPCTDHRWLMQGILCTKVARGLEEGGSQEVGPDGARRVAEQAYPSPVDEAARPQFRPHGLLISALTI